MGRMYVPSTPYTRGEKDVAELDGAPAPAELSHEDLESAAADRGYKLVPIEPAASASTEEWLTFARRSGAEDADLVDDKGKPLGRDALREKFGTPAEKTEVTGD